MDEAALFELAGHPHVFEEAGAAMEVVRGEPKLVFDEHDGGCARLVPDDGDSEDYIDDWLRVLHSDSKAIFTAARRAEKATRTLKWEVHRKRTSWLVAARRLGRAR